MQVNWLLPVTNRLWARRLIDETQANVELLTANEMTALQALPPATQWPPGMVVAK